MTGALVLHADDDVAILSARAGAGDDPLGLGAPLGRGVAAGHKIARRRIAEGDPVRKFGQVIGVAKEAIAAGAHVHGHNLGMGPHRGDQGIGTGLDAARAAIPDLPPRSFMGYVRDDGTVGTRNTIALCATVNCSATVIHRAAAELRAEGALDPFDNVDAIAAFAHGTGCGMSGTGEGAAILDRVLWGHASHPNTGAAIFVGLGCEVMQVARMQARAEPGPRRFHFLTIQETGGTRATIEAIKSRIRDLLPGVNAVRRSACPVSALRVALQCGGSDGLSGVTANPALGLASDALVGMGGTVILSETREIYGAEQLLLARAADGNVARRLRERIDWWQDYVARHGATLDNNPSPGNKQGGLTTILEKSLGAVAKGGSTPLMGVCGYAEAPSARGLVFMDSPGFDPVSVTGQIAAGAQIVCFTTGRGSAFGSQPAPTLKLATNDDLMAAMPDDMDIGCGDVLRGTSLAAKGAEIVERVLATASGARTKSEALGLGDEEFVPWQIGAVL